jgi:hypothetical protein
MLFPYRAAIYRFIFVLEKDGLFHWPVYISSSLYTRRGFKKGAMTLSIVTVSIMTLSIMGLFATLNITDTQHKRHSA